MAQVIVLNVKTIAHGNNLRESYHLTSIISQLMVWFTGLNKTESERKLAKHAPADVFPFWNSLYL